MRIKKSNELLWLLGTVFVALGVSICSKADLGVSMIAAPPFVIFDAIKSLSPLLSVGVVEYIVQGILLIVLCVIVRRFNWRYLLAFAVAVIYGYTLDLFIWLLGGIVPGSIAMRYVMLIIGDTITAFGVACFFRTYMPLQVYELFVAEIATKFNLTITKVKAVFDISLLVISVILALTLFGDVKTFDWSTIYYSSYHSIGIGTLITTIINSPLIKLMGKLIDKLFDQSPRFTKLENILKR
ncbi:MAG: hypothetical protein J6S00_06980 [Clostridia bacterium]|nr:hypothetical protein [Clostridia bacterium]